MTGLEVTTPTDTSGSVIGILTTVPVGIHWEPAVVRSLLTTSSRESPRAPPTTPRTAVMFAICLGCSSKSTYKVRGAAKATSTVAFAAGVVFTTVRR